jgi:hypothetical protein
MKNKPLALSWIFAGLLLALGAAHPAGATCNVSQTCAYGPPSSVSCTGNSTCTSGINNFGWVQCDGNAAIYCPPPCGQDGVCYSQCSSDPDCACEQDGLCNSACGYDFDCCTQVTNCHSNADCGGGSLCLGNGICLCA